MSVEIYSRMSIDTLIDEFVNAAMAMRQVLTLPPNNPEREARKREFMAIGAELRARGPTQKLRVLFDHKNDDVRTFAAAQFVTVDEEWALATMGAITERLPTKEVVELCARARRGPPTPPVSKDMSAQQLVARFEDAGMRKFATRFMGDGDEAWDVELCNQIISEMIDIVEALKSTNALTALLPLLDHANISVRGAAASRCLAIAPELAVPVLDAIAASGDVIEEGRASWTLDRWRKENGAAAAP
jgi:Domain of unknown function (DUF2019)